MPTLTLIPLRLIGLNSHSGYSTVEEGYLPFGFSADQSTASTPAWSWSGIPLEYVTANSPDAAGQIVSGIFPNDRWMSGAGIVVLKGVRAPQKAERRVLYSTQRRRQVTLLLDGREVATHTYPGPGAYKLTSAEPLQGSTVEVTWTGPSPPLEISGRSAWCCSAWVTNIAYDRFLQSDRDQPTRFFATFAPSRESLFSNSKACPASNRRGYRDRRGRRPPRALRSEWELVPARAAVRRQREYVPKGVRGPAGAAAL